MFAATAGGVLVSKDKGSTLEVRCNEAAIKQPAHRWKFPAKWFASVGRFTKRLFSIRPIPAPIGFHGTHVRVRWQSAPRRIDDQNLFITSNMGLYSSRRCGRTWNRADMRELQFQDAAGAGNARLASLQRHGR